MRGDWGCLLPSPQSPSFFPASLAPPRPSPIAPATQCKTALPVTKLEPHLVKSQAAQAHVARERLIILNSLVGR